MRNAMSQSRVMTPAILPTWSYRMLLSLLIATLLSGMSFAAVPDRIPETIDSNQKLALKGNIHGWAQARYDLGRADSSRMIRGLSLAFRPSAAQQKDLNNLLAQQQDRKSPNYHKWLTPAQYADRFGMSANDIKHVTTWLQSQGFAVTSVANGRNKIYFDGTVAQIEATFSTEMHNYQVNGERHLANATEPSLPLALVDAVIAIGHLNDFSPKPRAKVRPNLTSYVSGNHFLSPGDFATIYDLQPLYTAGDDGTGQTIAVVGQTTVSIADLNDFRTAAGLPASTVTMTLVEGTATQCAGDEGEADLDIEWSGGVAKGAQIIFVYAGLGTGDTCTARVDSVWDALDYAVQHNVAPIVSTSYGFCESGLGTTFVTALQTTVQQGNTQGQTVVAASGDAGAADCDPSSSTTAVSGLAVDVPAAIPEVTGMGGTEFSGDTAGVVTGTTAAAAPPYWSASGASSDTVSSALEYIPEIAWNDTAANIAAGGGFGASGGGASLGAATGFFAKPTWQAGTGVPADGNRDVPDLSLDASADHDGYLFCSEDAGTNTCTVGFRDSAGGNFAIVGGTSAAAPTFAGMLAIINQYLGNVPPAGLGNINATLYQLPGNSPAPFHDITTGDNKVPCTAGTVDCPTGTTEIGFSAGVGYDQVTGLGSVDGYALAQVLARTSTTTAISASSSSANLGASVTYTATVTPATVTGSVNFYNNGSATALGSGTLSSGIATFATTALPLGSNSVTAIYGGDTSNRLSTSVPAVTSVATGFSLTSNLTGNALSVAQGSTSTPVNLTVTSTMGFVTNSTTVLPVTYSCAGLPSESSCTFTPGSTSSAAAVSFTVKTTAPSSAMRSSNQGIRMFYAALLPGVFGILFIGFPRKTRSRGMRVLGLIVVLGFSTAWMASCGGSSGSSGTTDPGTAKGTSTVTVNATTGGTTPVTASPVLSFSLTVN
jgi:Pro-kumamolisin, activation domain/Bacterial Ig-like domain (group 3)